MIHTVGKIDRKIYKCIANVLITDEVIITDNQLRHILDRHPDAYNEVINYLSEIICDPDFIIEDKHKNTGLVIKKIKSEKGYATKKNDYYIIEVQLGKKLFEVVNFVATMHPLG